MKTDNNQRRYIPITEVARYFGTTYGTVAKLFPNRRKGKVPADDVVKFLNDNSVSLPPITTLIKMKRDKDIAKENRRMHAIDLTVANIRRMCAPTRYNILPHVRIGPRAVAIPDGILDQYEGYINSRTYVDMRVYSLEEAM